MYALLDEGLEPVDPASFARLWREHNALRRDFDQLLRCLDTRTGCHGSSEFHALKFAAACRLSPLGPDGPTLAQALEGLPLRRVQQFCGDRREMLALREASAASRPYAEGVFVGYEIYVCGGIDSFGGSLLESADCLSVQDEVWEAWTPPPTAPAGAATALLDGCLYACGSFGIQGKAVQRFCLARREWREMAPMNKARHGAAAAVVGGRLCICGGEDHLEQRVHSSIEVFESPSSENEAGDWRILPSAMGAKRRALAAATIVCEGREELLICCGVSSPLSRGAVRPAAIQSAEALDFGGQWPAQRRLPPMAIPRWGPVAASLGGRVYVCGGMIGSFQALSAVECFDAASETWTSSPPMEKPRSHASAVVVAGRLYVLGGLRMDRPAVQAARSVQCLDPATGLWEVLDWQLDGCGRESFCAWAAWRGALRP